MTPRIREVVVVGGGIAAAMAAVALARRVPNLRVIQLDPCLGLDPLEDWLGAARPSIHAFHQSVGIDDTEMVVRTRSGFRLGTVLAGFGPQPFLRGHGRMLDAVPGTPVHQLWLRQGHEIALDGLSPAASLVASEHFAFKVAEPSHPFAGLDHGLQLRLDAYRKALLALGKVAGVVQRKAQLAGVELAADGQTVAALRLGREQQLAADFFVDATGSEAKVRGALPLSRVDWSDASLVDRLSMAPAISRVPAGPADRVWAMPNGWHYEAQTPGGSTVVIASASRYSDSEDPAREVQSGTAAEPRSATTFRQGRLCAPFMGNVVAIGAAAVILDPLAATGIHLLCRQIERLVSMWPNRGFTRVEVDLFNRRSSLEADRARDFVQLHYHLGQQTAPGWRAAAAAPVSDALACDIALFSERGRLALHDEDSFERDEWVQLLIGLGVRPRRVDALANAVPPGAAAEAMARASVALKRAAQDAPTQDSWIRRLSGELA
jgi:tryptophan halogenase